MPLQNKKKSVHAVLSKYLIFPPFFSPFQLTQKTERFILRRTQVLNRQYLPAKCEYTVFCRLTPLQSTLYKSLCTLFTERDKKLPSNSLDALPLITNLKKLCNHPDLIWALCQEGQKSTLPSGEILPHFPEEYETGNAELSGKMLFTAKLLEQIRQNPTKDRVVIVSNYTEV